MTAQYVGWSYRESIAISNATGATLTNYVAAVVLSSSNFQFAHALSDGADIRVADSSDTVLDYWLQSFDATAQTGILRVRIPSLTTAGSTIYVYYGKSGATTLSDWTATFRPSISAVSGSIVGSGPGTFTAFPTVTKLANGSWLGTFTTGDSDGAANTATYTMTSTDEGATWSTPALAFSPSSGLGAGVQNNPLQLASGTILATLTFTAPPYTSQIPKVSTSTDNGATWSAPATISPPSGYTWMQFFGPMKELTAGGTIWATAYGLNTASTKTHSLLLTSADHGATWSLRAVIASHASRNYSEAAVYRKDATKALAFLREDNSTVLYYSESTDDGLTWSTPVHFCGGAVSPHLLPLATAGELLLTAGRRANIKGIAAWLSTDYGVTWSARTMPVRDAAISQTGYPSCVEKTSGAIGMLSYDNRSGSVVVYSSTIPKAFLTAFQREDWSSNIESDWDAAIGSGLSTGTHRSKTALHISDTGSTEPGVVNGTVAGTTGHLSLTIDPVTAPNGLLFSLMSGIGSQDSGTKYRFHFRVNSSGALQYYNGSAWTALPTPTTLTLNSAWWIIDLIWDTAAETCEVWVNGGSKGSVGKYESGGAITRFWAQSGSGGGTGDEGYLTDTFQMPYASVRPVLTFGYEELYSVIGVATVSAAVRGLAVVAHASVGLATASEASRSLASVSLATRGDAASSVAARGNASISAVAA